MKRAHVRMAAVLGLILALAISFAACDTNGDTGDGDAAAEPYKVGVMESVTGPGESYGTVMVQAKQMAVDEINAAGGVNGTPLRLIIEDSKCGAADAITAYNKLTDVDGVKIILGTSCSGAMLGAAPLAEGDGVVMLSASATNPDIAEAGDYIFRTAINDNNLGIDTGNTMWSDGHRTIATINELTDYAEGVRRTSVERFEALGGSVSAAESYASDVTDFRSQLTKLTESNPDAIHVAAQSEFTGGTIVKQLRELAAECLKETEDDQDANGFRDCLYDLTYSGAIGDDYSFDDKGEVEGLSNVVVEVLPVGQRTDDNQGYSVLGSAPSVE